jgi:hypothetical protein
LDHIRDLSNAGLAVVCLGHHFSIQKVPGSIMTATCSLKLRNSNTFVSMIIFKLVEWGVKFKWVHSALRPLIGLLCQPRAIMLMEKLVECLAGETEVLGENLPQCRFVPTNPTCCPDANPGLRDGKPATNRLSYGTALSV